MSETDTSYIHFSASQFETAKDCMRKWAWVYVAKKPKYQAKSAALGDATHQRLEAAGKGIVPNPLEVWSHPEYKKPHYPGKIALSMLHTLSREYPFDIFQQEAVFEHEFDFIYRPQIVENLPGVKLVGKIDILSAYGEPYSKDAGLFIVDHKTSSDPSLWGKKPENAETDIQRIVYCNSMNFLLPEFAFQPTTFLWNYGSTKYEFSKNYTLEYAEDRIKTAKAFGEIIEPLINEMYEIKTCGIDPNELEPNIASCDKYGGCPHKNYCHRTAGQRIGGIIMASALQQRLMERKNQQTAAAAPPAPTKAAPPPKAGPGRPPKAPPAPAKAAPPPKAPPAPEPEADTSAQHEAAEEAFDNTAPLEGTESVTRQLYFLAGAAASSIGVEAAQEQLLDIMIELGLE